MFRTITGYTVLIGLGLLDFFTQSSGETINAAFPVASIISLGLAVAQAKQEEEAKRQARKDRAIEQAASGILGIGPSTKIPSTSPFATLAGGLASGLSIQAGEEEAKRAQKNRDAELEILRERNRIRRAALKQNIAANKTPALTQKAPPPKQQVVVAQPTQQNKASVFSKIGPRTQSFKDPLEEDLTRLTGNLPPQNSSQKVNPFSQLMNNLANPFRPTEVDELERRNRLRDETELARGERLLRQSQGLF